MQEILQRGAEAIIYLKGEEIVKERIKKSYRIPQLDIQIRKQRTKSEAKLMERARLNGVNVPNVRIEDDFKLVMSYIRGERLKEILNKMEPRKRDEVCYKIGKLVAKLHEAGIMHGDLTTSNMILSKNEVFLIDFGLGKFSHAIEDQAVDLFLLYEALKAAHFDFLESSWAVILKAYEENYKKAKDVIRRVEKIKKRRRYK